MTSATYESNSILAYVGSDADVVGVSGLVVLPDWEGASVFFFQTSELAGPGIRKFDIDPDGDETLQRSKTAIGTAYIDAASGGAAAISYDGSQIFFIANTGNSVQLAEVAAADLSLTATFGTSSSSTLPSTLTRVLTPHIMTVQNKSGNPTLLLGSAFSTEELDSIPQSGFSANTNLGGLTQTVAFGNRLSRGNVLSSGPCYALGCPFQSGTLSAANSDPIELYSISTAGAVTSEGTFDFADIDATWTRIFSIVGMAFDETDGNVLIGVETDESGPTNKKYIAKLSVADASVLWACPVNQIATYTWGMTHSRIRNSRYHHIGGSNTIYHIDTTDGSVTTETTFGTTISAAGPQVSDDVSNSIIAYGSFSPNGTPPDYLGTYMDAGGHHTLSGQWMRLWFATVGASVPSDPPGGNMGGLALSELRAWTFTLDKHKFYVLDLGAEGTWVYDLLTGEWSRFYTDGYNGRWDAANGVMWQQRIVAGDLESTYVWEVSPSVAVDNDALDIAHVVTGGLQYRGRDAVSCDRVSVATTVGKLGKASSTLYLRFSDDGGNTWSDYYSVVLTHATHTTWADFLSLGSFAAPGRVFEVSDASGPVRIDGMEAVIGGDKGGAG